MKLLSETTCLERLFFCRFQVVTINHLPCRETFSSWRGAFKTDSTACRRVVWGCLTWESYLNTWIKVWTVHLGMVSNVLFFGSIILFLNIKCMIFLNTWENNEISAWEHLILCYWKQKDLRYWVCFFFISPWTTQCRLRCHLVNAQTRWLPQPHTTMKIRTLKTGGRINKIESNVAPLKMIKLRGVNKTVSAGVIRRRSFPEISTSCLWWKQNRNN